MKKREQIAIMLLYVLFIYGVALALTSCKSSNYSQHDCYKVKYAKVKQGKGHTNCDAYN